MVFFIVAMKTGAQCALHPSFISIFSISLWNQHGLYILKRYHHLYFTETTPSSDEDRLLRHPLTHALAETATVNTANFISNCVHRFKHLHVPVFVYIQYVPLICCGESVGWGKAWMHRQTNTMIVCSITLWYYKIFCYHYCQSLNLRVRS